MWLHRNKSLNIKTSGSLVKKLAGETALYGMSSIVARLLNFLLVPLYTRLLPREEYGIVTDLYAWTAFLLVLWSYRFESAFFRFGTPVEDRNAVYATGMRSLLASTAVLTAGLFAAAQPIATALGYPEHPEYIRWFALILAFDALSELPFARLRLEQRPLRFVSAKILNIGVYIGFNLFWLLFCPWADRQGVQAVRMVWSPSLDVEYIFLSNVLAGGVTLLFLWPQMRALQLAFDAALWKKMMRYAWPLIIVGFAGMVNEMLSRVMLKYLLTGTPEENLAQLGVFGANYKLAMLITLFTQAYRYAAEPFFFRNAASDNALHTHAAATKWFTIVTTAGMLAILLFMDVVQHFIGRDYRSGLHVVPVLLLANVFLGIYYNLSVWFRLKDKTTTGAVVAVAGALVTILLNLWWIPRFGYTGASWATLVCYGFMCAATWWTGRRHYPVQYPFGSMAFYIGLTLVLYALSQGAAQRWPDSPFLLWTLRTFLFMFFVAVVWKKEKLPSWAMGRRANT